MVDDLQARKQRFLDSATIYIEEAQSFLDYLDNEHPEVYIQRAGDLRRKLEMVLDRLHALIRDNKIREAMTGYNELTDLFTEFCTGVAVEMKRPPPFS